MGFRHVNKNIFWVVAAVKNKTLEGEGMRLELVKRLECRHRAPVTGLVFISKNELVSCSADGTCILWNLEKDKRDELLRCQHGFSDVAFEPKNGLLALACDDNKIHLISMEKKEYISLEGHESFVFCVRFNPTGNVLASASFDQCIRIWDPVDGKHASF